MRRNQVLQTRVNSAEKALVKRAVEASDAFDSVSELVRAVSVEWADRVMEELVQQGPTIHLDVEEVAEEVEAGKVKVKA